MTPSPIPFWTSLEAGAEFSPAGDCAKRAEAFEASIRRRNRIEYLAGVIVIAIFTAFAAVMALAGYVAMAAAALLVDGGVLFALGFLWLRGSPLPPRPEASCREHLIAQLVRQRDVLRNIPIFYVLPLMPGLVAIYVVAMTGVAEARGWEAAIGGSWVPVLATIGALVGMVVLNFAAARRIDADIAALSEQG